VTDLNEIQEFYNRMCKKYNKLSVKAYFVHDEEESLKLANRKLDYRGLYIEIPFRKIFLNRMLFNNRTIFHELFHHLNPHLKDGPKFEKLLDEFIYIERLDDSDYDGKCLVPVDGDPINPSMREYNNLPLDLC